MTADNAKGGSPRTAVLVVSCDKYADLWHPFFALFFQRWADCPFPVYLGANTTSYPDPRVRTILAGPDQDWSTNLRRMLAQIDSEYVVLMLEDFLLTRPVDTPRVKQLVDVARSHRVGSLLLVPHRPPFIMRGATIEGLDGVERVARHHPYRVTTQVGVWRKDCLEQLLLPGLSAWDFEVHGSAYSRRLADEFWQVMAPAVHYEHGVEKGRWRPIGLAICRDAGVPVDLGARGQFSEREMERHVRQAASGVAWYWRYENALGLFREGRRWSGARVALRSVVRAPWRLKMWAVLVFGLVGPRATEWLERQNVDRKLATVTKRVRGSASADAAVGSR